MEKISKDECSMDSMRADMHMCVSAFRSSNSKGIKAEGLFVRIFMPFELQREVYLSSKLFQSVT